MATGEHDVGLDDLVSPFLFVAHGDPDPVEWKAAHPGWVSFPAVMVPRADPPAPGNASGPRGAEWPKDRWGHSYRPFDDYGPGERAPGERSAEHPEHDPAAFRAMMAVMDDPVGTLRGAGYDLVAAHRPVPAKRVPEHPEPARHNPEYIERFFNDLDPVLQVAAKNVGIPVEWLEGLAAFEGQWFGDHARDLNNTLGLTHGGGNDLRFKSVEEAVRYWTTLYANQVRGATSPSDFAARLEGMLNGVRVAGWHRYNDRNPTWQAALLETIATVQRRRSLWLQDTHT